MYVYIYIWFYTPYTAACYHYFWFSLVFRVSSQGPPPTKLPKGSLIRPSNARHPAKKKSVACC